MPETPVKIRLIEDGIIHYTPEEMRMKLVQSVMNTSRNWSKTNTEMIISEAQKLYDWVLTHQPIKK